MVGHLPPARQVCPRYQARHMICAGRFLVVVPRFTGTSHDVSGVPYKMKNFLVFKTQQLTTDSDADVFIASMAACRLDE
jgi:hypothetical protein